MEESAAMTDGAGFAAGDLAMADATMKAPTEGRAAPPPGTLRPPPLAPRAGFPMARSVPRASLPRAAIHAPPSSSSAPASIFSSTCSSSDRASSSNAITSASSAFASSFCHVTVT